MNSLLEYMYGDAGNYKWADTVVVAGALSKKRLTPYLRDHQFLIPSKVGLADLQPNPWTEDNHIWREICIIENTLEPPSVNFDTTELLLRFQIANENEWYELTDKVEDWFV